MEPAKICIHQMWISCAKSVGCRFVARSKLVPAIIAAVIQLSHLNFESDTTGF